MANSPPLSTGLPPPPNVPAVDNAGVLNPSWYTLLYTLWARLGGANGSLSPLLDLIVATPGALIVRGVSIWQGLAAGARYRVLRMGVSQPEWDLLDGNSFGAVNENLFFASPAATASGIPSFRQVATADFAPVAGQFPGVNTAEDALAGNVGEYLASQVNVGAAIVLANGTPADIASISLPAGDWDAWANLSTAPTAGAAQTSISGWISATSATDPNPPNSGAYAQIQTAFATSGRQTLAVGQTRFSLATTTTIHLSATVAFTGAVSGYGFLGARRRR